MHQLQKPGEEHPGGHRRNGHRRHRGKVENIMDIMKYNVLRTPALVVDEKVKIMGRVPNVEEIKKYLK
jgi:hypothetical protein